jgi:hypothetical protein
LPGGPELVSRRLLANRAATNQIDDREQDDRADQRGQERRDRDRLVDRAPKISDAMNAPTMPTTTLRTMPCCPSVHTTKSSWLVRRPPTPKAVGRFDPLPAA